MPFTPYHLGIALLIGVLFHKKIDLPSILAGSIVLDIWPFLVLMYNLPYPLHGFSHSFLVAFIAGIILAFLRLKINIVKCNYSFPILLLGSVLGTFSHVILDTPLYNDILPFWPLTLNPFLGLYSYEASVQFSIFCFVAAFVVMVIKRKEFLNS